MYLSIYSYLAGQVHCVVCWCVCADGWILNEKNLCCDFGNTQSTACTRIFSFGRCRGPVETSQEKDTWVLGAGGAGCSWRVGCTHQRFPWTLVELSLCPSFATNTDVWGEFGVQHGGMWFGYVSLCWLLSMWCSLCFCMVLVAKTPCGGHTLTLMCDFREVEGWHCLQGKLWEVDKLWYSFEIGWRNKVPWGVVAPWHQHLWKSWRFTDPKRWCQGSRERTFWVKQRPLRTWARAKCFAGRWCGLWDTRPRTPAW